MKVGTISGDMVVKLALGVAVLGGIAYAVYKIKGALPDAIKSINPADPENVVNKAVNTVGGAIVSTDGPGRNADGSWSLGGWLFDVLNPDTAQAVKEISGPVEPSDPYDHIFYRRPPI